MNKIQFNKIQLFLITNIIFLQYSCKDFLDLAPITQTNVSSFYQTQEDFENAIVSVYDSWQSIYPGLWTYYTEFRGDTYDRENQKLGYEVSSNNWTLNTTAGMWNRLYKVVSNANIILDKIESKKNFESDVKSRIQAEARFFRAEAYFALVRLFGSVPLVDTEISSLEAVNTFSAKPSEIYRQIEEDYMFAINHLPASVPGSDYGRITKYAAEGELARVYITLSGQVHNQDRWMDAKLLLENILFSSPYSFAESYSDIFAEDGGNEKGKEVILSVLFSAGNQGEASGYEEFIGKYRPLARHITFEPGVVESYEHGDLRKEVNIVNGYHALDIDQWVDGHWINVKFDYLYDIESNSSGMDFPLIRYTDMYLLYAETLAEISGSVPDQSLEILNEVRNRAGLNSLTRSDVPDISTFRTLIQKERRSELMFECVRWFDLVRTGKAVEALRNIGKDADDSWLLFPIPQSEIDKVGEDVLPQNPGY
ncbi:RagB/SusD family nutrient uptake outer membrane protein [Membranihabitans maritimus]|uniref:RagB/SusD family nutrient uptake outer membrane protein n=1 Tax=Membranihabitans maritimus TaxID=2904244 RepID=UPI001F22BDDF|nr:RagB/SusD family nutrient uptake outer membrane protein [Membranihabitans maritimus]